MNDQLDQIGEIAGIKQNKLLLFRLQQKISRFKFVILRIQNSNSSVSLKRKMAIFLFFWFPCFNIAVFSFPIH
jgi:hypothetical protein